MPAPRALAIVAGALLLSGCVPGLGPFRLPEVHGRVVDAETGAPLPGAEVFEWHRGAGLGDGSRPVYHARFATCDAEGRFHLPGGFAPSPRMWLLRTYEPLYAFHHPGYGLQRGARAQPDGTLRLAGTPVPPEIARADLQPYCRGEHDDAGARRLAEIACAPTPDRGSP